MTELKTYSGGCHCKNVRFEVTMDTSKANTCNCSICSKAGWVLGFAPAEQFKLLSGADSLTDYQFGKKSIHHFFCSTCGVRSFSRGTVPGGGEMHAVNVRCLDDVDINTIPTSRYDGKKL